MIMRFKPEIINGKVVEFVKESKTFAPGKFQYEEHVVAYIDDRPYASAKTKKEAIWEVRRLMKIGGV